MATLQGQLFSGILPTFRSGRFPHILVMTGGPAGHKYDGQDSQFGQASICGPCTRVCPALQSTVHLPGDPGVRLPCICIAGFLAAAYPSLGAAVSPGRPAAVLREVILQKPATHGRDWHGRAVSPYMPGGSLSDRCV